MKPLRQRRNRARHAQCLRQVAEYPYRVARMNNDSHWRVEVQGTDYDFWPHTGTWQNPRDHTQRGTALDFNDFVGIILKLHSAHV